MTSDNIGNNTYAQAMERGLPFIRLKLDTDDPIEMGAFVGAFTSLGAEYDRHMRFKEPGITPEATLYVQDVRDGCIEASLIPWIVGGLVAVVTAANSLDEFVERYGARIGAYLKPGGRLPDATKAELKHFSEQVAAIANAPNASLEVAAIEIENGEQKVRAAFRFNTSQAREIEQRVTEHQRELERSSRSDKERVLMIFTRSDVRASPVGKRTGELVRIGSINDRSLPIVYASALAEQHIKHEISEGDDNVFKKGFVVDVNVEERGGKPIAYSVTNLHDVIDLPDDN